MRNPRLKNEAERVRTVAETWEIPVITQTGQNLFSTVMKWNNDVMKILSRMEIGVLMDFLCDSSLKGQFCSHGWYCC